MLERSHIFFLITIVVASFLNVNFSKVVFGCLALGSVAWLAYSWHQESKYDANSRDVDLDHIVPNSNHMPLANEAFDPVSDSDMNLLVVPQDSLFQVSLTDHNYKHIPRHPVLLEALKSLGEAKKRRLVAFKISLGSLEQFLAIYEYLKAKKLYKIGNSIRHERLKQRFSDMAMLRSECLEQLVSTAYDTSFAKFDGLDKSVASIRDYTQYLYAETVSKWVKVIPGIGDAEPPHGMSTSRMNDVMSSMYRS